MHTRSHHWTFLLSIPFYFSPTSFSIYSSMIPTCFHVPLLEVPRVCMAAYIRTRLIDTYNHHRIVWYSMQNTLYHHTVYAQLHMISFLFLLLTFLRSVAIMSWASLDVGFLGEGPVEIQSTFVFSSPISFFFLPLDWQHLIKPLIGEHNQTRI